MSENRARLFELTIRALTEMQFQFLCGRYLRDQGYNIRSGPLRGPDGSADIVGDGKHGQFVGHCTTQKTNLRQKFMEAIPSAMAANDVLGEIAFFSVKDRPLGVPSKEQEFLTDRFLPALAKADSRYTGREPTISVHTGPELAREIAAASSWSSYSFLLQEVRDLSHTSPDDDYTPSLLRGISRASPDDLHELLQSGLTLPQPYRTIRFEKVCQLLADEVLFDPILAEKTLDRLSLPSNADAHQYAALLSVPAKMATHSTLDPSELRLFFTIVATAKAPSGQGDSSAAVLGIRVLRGLLYRGEYSLIDTPEIMESLLGLTDESSFWRTSLSDIYIRAQVGFLYLPDPLRGVFESAFVRFLKEEPDNLLVRLVPILSSPERFVEKRSKDEVVDYFEEVVIYARTDLERKWLLVALQRCLALYRSRDRQSLWRRRRALLELIRSKTVADSRFVIVLRLNLLVEQFLFDRDTQTLALLEQELSWERGKLLTPQIQQVQFELACCLLLALDELGDGVWDLRFMRQLRAGENPFHHAALAIPALNYAPRIPGTLARQSATKLLRAYIAVLYEVVLGGQIGVRPSAIWRFPAALRVQVARTRICSSWLSVLQGGLPPWNEDSPDGFFGRLCGLGSLVSVRNEPAAYLNLACRALCESSYAIAVNADSIARVLFHLKEYTAVDRVKVHAVAVKLSDCIADKSPRLAHGFVVAQQYAIYPEERRFLLDLWNQIVQDGRGSGGLRPYSLPIKGMHFSADAVAFVRSRTTTSTFARVLNEDLLDPEAWNLFGTVLARNEGQEPDIWERIAGFYAFATAFGREAHLPCAKYSYNFIRAASRALLLRRERPPEWFVSDSLKYLKTHEATMFFYRVDATIDFFFLLLLWRRHFSAGVQEEIVETLGRMKWLHQPGKKEPGDGGAWL